MDDFTSRIEELTSKFSERRVPSHQNMANQAESCNGSATSLFMAGLGNGSLTGQLLPNSGSSNQLAREIPLMEEVCRSSSLSSLAFVVVIGGSFDPLTSWMSGFASCFILNCLNRKKMAGKKKAKRGLINWVESHPRSISNAYNFLNHCIQIFRLLFMVDYFF